jgi:cytochrome c oxidase assembly protein subunit 11
MRIPVHSLKQFSSKFTIRRKFSTNPDSNLKEKNKTLGLYLGAIAILGIGLGYASAPLYRIFCQTTGFGGTTQRKHPSKVPDSEMQRLEEGRSYELKDEDPQKEKRLVTVEFASNVGKNMPWSFYPMQNKIEVYPGETALAFFKAKNHSDKAITGVATYNVLPFSVGLYFSKIQCFCFEEQRLRPHEEIEMPVLFYIEPDIEQDTRMKLVNNVLLGYTFFAVDEDDDDDDQQKAKQSVPEKTTSSESSS